MTLTAKNIEAGLQKDRAYRKEAAIVLEALLAWYECAVDRHYVSEGPSPDALLFDDDFTLAEHLDKLR